MDISETCVKTVGVFRCCLEAPEKLKTAEYGDTVTCDVCGTVLTLYQVPHHGPVWLSKDQKEDEIAFLPKKKE